MKQPYNNLCIVFNSSQGGYLKGGERTLFSELFVQQFKNFAKMSNFLEFTWIEKKMPNVNHSWLVKKDFVKKDIQLKLLDGVGMMKKNKVNFIVIESPGVGEDIFKHTLEDTVNKDTL
ncbi:hypothetical protein HMPREF1544_08789 [Mucor circinelloides 1006PhL]|uniref:Uncharacterized protein n=1 Tax=Mucor circinelloides f. circinelloides (strain 1006PhL) TaxID=1220926 RepID=S2JX77_MUCC1|nr:hypothetical protein HMPREF1544_08789 [Mucor circinelloides 1006PhL]